MENPLEPSNFLPGTKRRWVQTAYGYPQDYHGRFVYTVVSPRAKGLSIGLNMNPDRRCSFDCVYCEINRNAPTRNPELDLIAVASELERTMELVLSGRIRERPAYCNLPEQLLQLRHLCLSGEGEPTQSPVFVEAVEMVIHLRARARFPFFRIVLLTNATGLDRAEVQQGLRFFTRHDEIWAKLDGGTQEYMDRINRSNLPLEKILENILLVARQRPVVIQTLFPAIKGQAPSSREIEAYAGRLKDLTVAGARIPLVQIYSATRPVWNTECGHLPLRTLSMIAQRVREITALKVEVY